MKKTNLIAWILSQALFLLILPFILDLFHYLHLIVYAVIWVCLTIIVFYYVYVWRNERLILSKSFFIGGIILYSICLVILLFFRPSNQEYGTYNLIPFETIRLYFSGVVSPLVAIYNLAANVGLFVPFGVALLLLCEKRPSITFMVVVPLLSIGLIEGMQYITRRGSLDIDDLILNLFGVGMGYAITPFVRRRLLLK
ncbi:VanZ family protein [Peribacillus alkalitolerans]|uniref:VanZ family protein n=1 Tax=Peribacillus alkalitolerans TaxID=1550385 RepID=UPI0013D0910B|nr:VanZ family protein [Peribacillus alkalitolerans]